MDYFLKCLEQFSKLPEYARMAVGSETAVKFINDLGGKYSVDLKFAVILITIGELKLKDLSEYLQKKFNLAEEDRVVIKEQLEKHIFFGLSDILFPEKDEGVILEDLDLDQNEEEIIKMFQGNLVEVLYRKLTFAESRELNQKVTYVLAMEEKQQELEKALYRNEEELTHKHFILDKKPRTPSVKNWLTDFIKRHGTSIFNNVVLSNYITNSDNAKLLDAEEKKLVQKLLILYRNLKFFPESMRDAPVEKWEIIPIMREVESKLPRSGPAAPKSEEEKRLEELRRLEEKYAEGSLEREAIEEEIEEKLGETKKIKELWEIAEHYKEGSLERKAIEEEISKLES